MTMLVYYFLFLARVYRARELLSYSAVISLFSSLQQPRPVAVAVCVARTVINIVNNCLKLNNWDR